MVKNFAQLEKWNLDVSGHFLSCLLQKAKNCAAGKMTIERLSVRLRKKKIN
jgi:hypothetical protein